MRQRRCGDGLAGDRRRGRALHPSHRGTSSGPDFPSASAVLRGPSRGYRGSAVREALSPGVSHAGLSGEGGSEAPTLASVAPEFAQFPSSFQDSEAVWEEAAPASGALTLTFPTSLYSTPR